MVRQGLWQKVGTRLGFLKPSSCENSGSTGTISFIIPGIRNQITTYQWVGFFLSGYLIDGLVFCGKATTD